MEIENKNGFKTLLEECSENLDFGRESGFNSTDRTVSRRHISFKLHEDPTRVYFEVKGKNPVWVHDSINDQIRVYRRSEGGEMKSGDSFCVSSKNPMWFNLKKIAIEDEDDDKLQSELRFDDALAETSSSGINYDEMEIGDISHIDPVKEFNFIVMGHEFDCYPKKMIRDIRNWDWFLEEPKENSDDDEDDNERKAKKGTKKRKKGRGKNDDEDDVWTGESEEDAEMIKKLKNVPKPKYSTRSKNEKKNKKSASTSKSANYAKNDDDDDDDDVNNGDGGGGDDDDDDDETLGGFIVDDDETKEEDNEDDEEEEEFEEDAYDE